MSYMIILEPSKEGGKKYIQVSQNLFSDQNYGYLLKEDGIPHVTICQLECKEEESKDILENIKKKYPDPFSISFSSLSLVKSTIDNNGYYWAELTSFGKTLFKLYDETRSIIKSKSLSIINDYGENYRPHLTLARIKLPYTIKEFPSLTMEPEIFYLNCLPCIPPKD